MEELALSDLLKGHKVRIYEINWPWLPVKNYFDNPKFKNFGFWRFGAVKKQQYIYSTRRIGSNRSILNFLHDHSAANTRTELLNQRRWLLFEIVMLERNHNSAFQRTRLIIISALNVVKTNRKSHLVWNDRRAGIFSCTVIIKFDWKMTGQVLQVFQNFKCLVILVKSLVMTDDRTDGQPYLSDWKRAGKGS